MRPCHFAVATMRNGTEQWRTAVSSGGVHCEVHFTPDPVFDALSVHTSRLGQPYVSCWGFQHQVDQVRIFVYCVCVAMRVFVLAVCWPTRSVDEAGMICLAEHALPYIACHRLRAVALQYRHGAQCTLPIECNKRQTRSAVFLSGTERNLSGLFFQRNIRLLGSGKRIGTRRQLDTKSCHSAKQCTQIGVRICKITECGHLWFVRVLYYV